MQYLWRLPSTSSSILISHSTQHHLKFRQATAKTDAAKEAVKTFKSFLPKTAAAYLHKHGWVLRDVTDLVAECGREGLKLFGNLECTDEEVEDNVEYKVMFASCVEL